MVLSTFPTVEKVNEGTDIKNQSSFCVMNTKAQRGLITVLLPLSSHICAWHALERACPASDPELLSSSECPGHSHLAFFL